MSDFLPEILAPVGNGAALKAAIGSGADAVYLGLNKYNARAKADNFSIDNIEEVLDYAHLFGVKVYITMNTLLKDAELPEAVSFTKEVWKKGADAIIIQDLGFAERLKNEIPDIVLHASTQMGIHNYQGAIFARKLGFKRVILSRETTLEDIRQIRANSSVELEFFVHGALCVAFSGNCYLSSLASGYSGNRGKCMQLCRKKYILEVDGIKKEGYCLSTKDLNMLDCLNELKDAGITSFKIEGRLRRPEYVATVVDVYKRALKHRTDKKDMDHLKLAFNRGDFCLAHLFEPTSDTIYPYVQNSIGLEAGTVVNSDGKAVTLSCKLKAGDGIKFLRNNIEVGSASIRNDGNKTGFSGEVVKGDKVRITNSPILQNFIREPKIPVDVIVSAFIGKPLDISIISEQGVGKASSEFIIEKSKTADMYSCDIERQLRFNDTEFVVRNTIFNCDDNFFIPKSIINEVRRNAIASLKTALKNNYLREENHDIYESFGNEIRKNGIELLEIKDIIQIDSPEKLRFIPRNYCGYVAVNPDRFDLSYLKKFVFSKPLLLNLPPIARNKDLNKLREIVDSELFFGYIVNNLYGLELLKTKRVILGWQMNFLNSAVTEPKISSPEADTEISNSIEYSFGYVPLMTFSHCPRKSLNLSCNNCNKNYKAHLTDEMQLTFNLKHYSLTYCYAQLLNCLPIYNAVSKNKFIDLSGTDNDLIPELLSLILSGEKLPIATTKGNHKRGLD